MIRCDHCHAETTNGLLLCETCRAAVATYLEFLPVYFRNLARWRPERSGARTVPGSRPPAGVFPHTGDRIAHDLDEAGIRLSQLAYKLAKARPHHAAVVDRILRLDELASVHLLCRLFDRYLTSIATLDWAGDFVRDIATAEHQLRDLTERLVPGWYAGACRKCGHPTHVVPGLTWVTCNVCGVTTHASAHLDTILAEAADWTAPPMRLAEAIVALVDTEHDVARLYERVKKWGQRGHITAHRALNHDGQPYGPNRYRLGDVLELLTRDGATRLVERRTFPRVG